MKDYYWWFAKFGGFSGHRFNAMHAVWCLSFFVLGLLASTVYFATAFNQAEAHRRALCAEMRVHPDFKRIDYSGWCF